VKNDKTKLKLREQYDKFFTINRQNWEECHDWMMSTMKVLKNLDDTDYKFLMGKDIDSFIVDDILRNGWYAIKSARYEDLETRYCSGCAVFDGEYLKNIVDEEDLFSYLEMFVV
jgi:hypothetical protein